MNDYLGDEYYILPGRNIVPKDHQKNAPFQTRILRATTDRKEKREKRNNIHRLLNSQFHVLARLPRKVLAILDKYPDITEEELTAKLIPKKSPLSDSQRACAISSTIAYLRVRLKIRMGRLFANMASKSGSQENQWMYHYIPNTVVLADSINGNCRFLFFGKFPIAGSVEFAVDIDHITIYFGDSSDYYRAYGNECGTDKGRPSAGACLSTSVSIINVSSGVQTLKVKMHEGQHARNIFLFPDFNQTKDEIVAFMSDPNLSKESIAAVLSQAGGIYHYPEISDWEKHVLQVNQYLSLAFRIRDKFPENYINLLAVTPMRLWRRLIQ